MEGPKATSGGWRHLPQLLDEEISPPKTAKRDFDHLNTYTAIKNYFDKNRCFYANKLAAYVSNGATKEMLKSFLLSNGLATDKVWEDATGCSPGSLQIAGALLDHLPTRSHDTAALTDFINEYELYVYE